MLPLAAKNIRNAVEKTSNVAARGKSIKSAAAEGNDIRVTRHRVFIENGGSRLWQN